MGPGVRSATLKRAGRAGVSLLPQETRTRAATGRRARGEASCPDYAVETYHRTVTPNLDASARERILDFVRPLSVGIDGVTNFGFVERRLRISESLLEGEARGRRRGRGRRRPALSPRRVRGPSVCTPHHTRQPGGSAPALPPDSLRRDPDPRLFSQPLRVATRRSPEEKIVHDAILLESVGAYGVTQLLVAGARERMTLAEMAREIAEKMASARFVTQAGTAPRGRSRRLRDALRAEARRGGGGVRGRRAAVTSRRLVMDRGPLASASRTSGRRALRRLPSRRSFRRGEPRPSPFRRTTRRRSRARPCRPSRSPSSPSPTSAGGRSRGT